MIWDVFEKYIGHKERKMISVLLIILGGLSIISFTSSWFPFLDSGVTNYEFLSLRNLLGFSLVLVGIGWWKNRIG